MYTLTDEQMENGYFWFSGIPSYGPAVREYRKYDGRSQLCVCCTQLLSYPDAQGKGIRYTEAEKRHILNEWIQALSSQQLSLTALHLASNVPQRLFDAACCQSELVDFYCKFGKYADLTPLLKLKKLQFLHLGSCPSVTDISVLTQLKTLKVLYVQNFKKIEDYSPLAALDGLEQLVISGPTLNNIHVKDMEFLRDMPNLRSVRFANVTFRKKYTKAELQDLRAAVPQLYDMHGCIWGKIGIRPRR